MKVTDTYLAESNSVEPGSAVEPKAHTEASLTGSKNDSTLRHEHVLLAIGKSTSREDDSPKQVGRSEETLTLDFSNAGRSLLRIIIFSVNSLQLGLI